MNPDELNQTMLNHAMRVHNNCMDRCLTESEEYQIHNSIRELMVLECNQAALYARRWYRHNDRFNAHMPEDVRRQRKLEDLRKQRESDKLKRRALWEAYEK